jgi:integrase
LNAEERTKFAEVAQFQEREVMTFCLMLRETGVRISEALSLTVGSIDLSNKCVTVETIKKRNAGVFRQIPISDDFINTLNLVHEIRRKQKSKKSRSSPLWTFTRRTGSRKIDSVMAEAEITGAMACPKGLRHAFGVHCVMNEIPLPTIQKWLGHSSMETTAIYLNVMGKEERELASRIW